LFRDFAIRILKRLGRRLGARLVDAAEPAELTHELSGYRDGDGPERGPEHRFAAQVLKHFGSSRAQLYQDLFVLFQTGGKRSGYFVEIGASDGVVFSNTCLLEKEFGWSGILAEPARLWHDALRQNRRCSIDTRCVWSSSGEHLEFRETQDGGLSTIAVFSAADRHAPARECGRNYPVETVSLLDLLRCHGAPATIDYLSVDTEGSELAILEGFDFSSHDIRIITVEHNFTPARERLRALLQPHGYVPVFEKFSRWDGWYVKPQ